MFHCFIVDADFILVIQRINITKIYFRFRHFFILYIQIGLILCKKTGHFLNVLRPLIGVHEPYLLYPYLSHFVGAVQG